MNAKCFYRVTAAFLAIAISISLLACSESDISSDKTDTDISVSGDNISGETNPETIKHAADVPENADMNGAVMRFLTSNWPGEAVWTCDDIIAEELTGSAMNDAIYYRNLSVQDKLNCVIEETNLADGGTAYTTLKQSIMSGDGEYQIWISRLQQYLSAAADGNIMKLTDVPYINLEQPWWDKASVKELSFIKQTYIAVSDIVSIDDEAAAAIVFNKKLINDYQLDTPYDVVKEGKWTFDKFSEYVNQVAFDLNGDGRMDQNDRYGFMYQRDTMEAFLTGGNEATCRKDEYDIPYMSMGNERSITLLTKLTDLLYNKEICTNSMMLPGSDFNVAMNTMYQNDQALFMWVRMVNVPELRTMESDFGILPTPKYTEDQEKYRTWINSWTGAGITVPTITGASDAEQIGIFIEVMGAESRNLIVPAYYDVMLNGIVARDVESKEMLDILYGNSELGETIYDIGTTGCFAGIEQWIYMCMTYDNDFVSYIKTKEKSVNKTIEKLLEKFEDLY